MDASAYIEIVELEKPDDRKTKLWEVRNKAGVSLGLIKFWAHWRKFVFYPGDQVLFDSSCLLAIAAILDTKTLEWRANL